MGHTTDFGLRTAGAAVHSDATPTTPTTHKSGQRGVPATYGGRHHLGSRGPASLSDINPAAREYGGRHHYGAEIRGQMHREASSADTLAERVATEMFGDDEI